MPESNPPDTFKFDTQVQKDEGLFFCHPDWKTCSQGLSMHPEEATAFAISFGIHQIKGETSTGTMCFIWHKQSDNVKCTRMGEAIPELTKAFAVQGFTLLSFRYLRETAESIIRTNFPQFRYGTSLRVTVCAKGLLILPFNIDMAIRQAPLDQMLVARAPGNLSQHERLLTKVNLEACARSIIGHQHRYRDRDISVSIDMPDN